MEAKQVINIAGTICPPKNDKEFNKWYDEKHIPLNMKFKDLIDVTRYRLVKASDTTAFKKYPQYMTPYRFRDMATFERWNKSPELAAASEGAPEFFQRAGIELVWRVQYQVMQTWRDTPAQSVITLVASDCDPKKEERFNTWYSLKHVPDLLKFKGLQGVARLQLASAIGLGISGDVPKSQTTAYPRYLTFYYFKDKATNEAYDASPERTATLPEFQELIKEVGMSIVWRAQYEPMRTWRR